jgi:deazaflavin-dependent oxidoreductase (nitroreductase family)
MIGIPVIGHLTQWWREVGPGFNKSVLNPAMLRLAGRRHWYAARLEHMGRRSGRRYATPVVARRVPGGFAIPLPYGTDVDWLRNIRAAGTAVLVVDGSPHPVGDPRVVRFADVAPDLPWGARETYRRLVDGPWLRLTETATTAAAA